jgi:hypothetical protein
MTTSRPSALMEAARRRTLPSVPLASTLTRSIGSQVGKPVSSSVGSTSPTAAVPAADRNAETALLVDIGHLSVWSAVQYGVSHETTFPMGCPADSRAFNRL